MKLWLRFLPGCRCPLLAALLCSTAMILPLRAQQQPVSTVTITRIAVLSGTGQVCLINITNVGANYTTAPTITFSGGSPTTPATAHAVLDLSGAVSDVIIDNPGAGYTSAPTMTFTAPTSPPAGSLGVTAAATALVGTPFSQPFQNESYGTAGIPIAITAVATAVIAMGIPAVPYDSFWNGCENGVPTRAVAAAVTPNEPAGGLVGAVNVMVGADV